MVRETDKNKYMMLVVGLTAAVVILVCILIYQQRIHSLDIRMVKEKNERTH